MRVIGGPFVECPAGSRRWLWPEGSVWLLSGRIAFREILEILSVNTDVIWFPAYYCPDLVERARVMGFRVRYYDVNSSWGGGITSAIPDDADGAVVAMSFDGYPDSGLPQIARKLRSKGTKFVLDATHSLLSQMPVDYDYLFGSIRKWTGVSSGGFLICEHSVVTQPPSNGRGSPKVILEGFANEYRKYMETGVGSRSCFADLFWEVDRGYENAERGSGMYKEDLKLLSYWDAAGVAQSRRANALFLTHALQDTGLLAYEDLPDNAVPLFVPILLQNKDERDSLCMWLDDHLVYCDVAWHRPKGHPVGSDVIERRLGLVCDERYGEEDMGRISELVLEWLTRQSVHGNHE